MSSRLTERDARHRRVHAQRLAPHAQETATVADIAAATLGLQAQETPSAALSVRARGRGLTVADVDRALYEDRSVVRTWCMRGTLHLVATDDLSLLLSVFGPTFATRGPEPRRLAEWGLDEEAVEAAVETIGSVLADEGPLTKRDIAAHLVEAGVDVDPSSRAPNVLIRRAALRGVLCEVAPVDGKNAYDLLDSWVTLDAPPDRETALATLARRYLTAYGPTTKSDFAAWSGLYATDVQTAWDSLGDDAREVRVGDETMWVSTDAPDALDDESSASPHVRLLPRYDTFLLGYERTNRPIPTMYESHVWPGGGIIRPTVLVDGRVVGTWHLDRSRSPAIVTVSPFEPLDTLDPAGGEDVRDRIDAEASDVGRFLDTPVECRVEPE
ncbi:winged helix DNA-binding domain-containing protein [Halomarina salina]|uniref:Winged helix DNA-binding domain-containing protein n=1 Tax=Halomarina salina TaxID=1872699 RepID=A0ABD5RKV4_9EURY|nr:winged helix DNA-binding domain-containing protein [Halomarina salina]